MDISGLILPVKLENYSEEDNALMGKLLRLKGDINQHLISVKQI